MSQMNIKQLALCSLLLTLVGCTYNPFKTEPDTTATVVEPQPVCSEACKTEAVKPLLKVYVERESSSTGLQLGAFKEPIGASKLIQRLSTNYPVVFESRSPIIRAIERDGTTLYRVILGPFSDPSVADAFCKLLRQHSEACFATTFDRVDLRVDLVADS